MAVTRLSTLHPDVADLIRRHGTNGGNDQSAFGQWNDPTQYGSYRQWYDSLTPAQQYWTQNSAYGRDSQIRNQAISHFGADAHNNPATRSIRNYTGQFNPLTDLPYSDGSDRWAPPPPGPTGGGIIQQPVAQPAIQRPAELGDLWGAGNTQLPAGTPNLLNPNGPTYPTIQPELNPLTPTPTPSAPTQPTPTQPSPQPSVPPISIFEPQPMSPYPTTIPDGGNLTPPGGSNWFQINQPSPGGQNQAPTGMFAPNPYLPGGWEATMFQDYANMPHIANPAAPEVALEGSYLNAGDTMRIPTNLMPNVPSQFGGLNQQTQWNGYWSPNMTGMVGPHGIAAGYGFYNSNSPVNYTGLFAQSNPFWGNPTTSPTMPTPSPSTLSPYYGVGPESHFGRYFQNMRQNAQTLGEQRAEEEKQRVSSQQQAIADMTGCPVDDLRCQARFWIDQGG